MSEASAREQTLVDTIALRDRVLATMPGIVYEFAQPKPGEERFTFVAGAVEETMGLSAEQITALGPGVGWQLGHPEDIHEVRQRLDHGSGSRALVSGEMRVGTEGNWRWVRYRQVPHEAPDGLRWTGVVVDVTEERRLRETLSRASRSALVADMTSGIAHNFNNMLSVVLPNVEMALEEAPPTPSTRPPPPRP